MAPKLTLPLLAKDVGEMLAKVEEHDKVLIRGEGPDHPGVVERVRRHDDIFRELFFWVRSIALLFAGQFITVLFAVIFFFVQVLPALMRLNEVKVFYLLRAVVGIGLGLGLGR